MLAKKPFRLTIAIRSTHPQQATKRFQGIKAHTLKSTFPLLGRGSRAEGRDHLVRAEVCSKQKSNSYESGRPMAASRLNWNVPRFPRNENFASVPETGNPRNCESCTHGTEKLSRASRWKSTPDTHHVDGKDRSDPFSRGQA